MISIYLLFGIFIRKPVHLMQLSAEVCIYLWFHVTFNTVQVISQWVVLWAEETSTYSWSGFCTVNY